MKQKKRPLQNSPANQQADKQPLHAPQGKPLCKVITHRCKLKSLLEQGPLIWLLPDKATRPKDSNYRLHYAAAKQFRSLLQQVSLFNHLDYKRRNSHPGRAKPHLRKLSSAPDQILLPALTMLLKWALRSPRSLRPLSGSAHQGCALPSLPTRANPAHATRDSPASPPKTPAQEQPGWPRSEPARLLCLDTLIPHLLLL